MEVLKSGVPMGENFNPPGESTKDKVNPLPSINIRLIFRPDKINTAVICISISIPPFDKQVARLIQQIMMKLVHREFDGRTDTDSEQVLG